MWRETTYLFCCCCCCCWWYFLFFFVVVVVVLFLFYYEVIPHSLGESPQGRSHDLELVGSRMKSRQDDDGHSASGLGSHTIKPYLGACVPVCVHAYTNFPNGHTHSPVITL